MLYAYVAGHATGHPSPGGYAYRLLEGDFVRMEASQTIQRTAPVDAALTGVRDALLDTPSGWHVTVIVADPLVEALLAGTRRPAVATHAQLCEEVATVAHLRRLAVQVMHTDPASMTHLQAAVLAAHDAARRAWITNNSPACPRCHGQMRSTSAEWRCLNPACSGRLRMYARRHA